MFCIGFDCRSVRMPYATDGVLNFFFLLLLSMSGLMLFCFHAGLSHFYRYLGLSRLSFVIPAEIQSHGLYAAGSVRRNKSKIISETLRALRNVSALHISGIGSSSSDELLRANAKNPPH